ncbi:GntR family transcriptional regulator [Kordiimonas sediminis]|uniref:GntR family transcriptional regulator n=1 Tax=Kordiimonas sediminis TaxID=1735581 RepID=A0A919AVY6_9PROT|nr:GntR family transcriptional regulator [Kordiimonas sediminis]GHF26128.1 GntR family transcriptional regulator [Kordiimonas sediminis]
MTKTVNQYGINFSAIERSDTETAQEWVYRALRYAVMSGQVQPGMALTIRGIANMLCVSAMPAREALWRLTSEGALHLKANRRVEVPTMSPAKLSEVLQLRILLETHAAERALPYVTEEILSQMAILNELQNEALRRQDPEQTIIQNQAFHRCLYEAHPNPVSMPLIEGLWLQLGPLHRLALSNMEDHYFTDRHVEVIKAVETQNPFGLKVAIESDIREGAGYATQTELLEQYARGEAPLDLPEGEFVEGLLKQ